MANIFITGASTGIGEATARHFDTLGHTVFAGVRNDADGDALRDGASSRLTPVICDVTDQGTIDSARKQIGESVSDAGLQGLINNAGIGVGGPVEYLPLDEWRWQFEVNLFGQIAVTQAFLDLIRQGRGRISFTGSIAGRHSSPMLGPYSASKHAVEALSQSMRGELQPWGIHVSVVEPGAITTPIWDKARDKFDEISDLIGVEAAEHYREGIETMQRGIDFQQKNSVPPAKVAEAFEHAMFSGRPKAQYLVGKDALALGSLHRVLPQPWVDRIVDRVVPG